MKNPKFILLIVKAPGYYPISRPTIPFLHYIYTHQHIKMKVVKVFPVALFISIALHGANAAGIWGRGKQDVSPLDLHLESAQEHLISR